MSGGPDLTPRQREVAARVAQALPDKRIACELGYKDARMIRIHIAAIAFLIGADPERNTRVQIALWWREQAPITVTDPPPLAAIANQETQPA